MKKIYLVLAIIGLILVVAFWRKGASTGDDQDAQVTPVPEKDVVVEMQYQYTAYSKTTFDGVAGKHRRILFFTSSACTSCQQMQDDIVLHLQSVPQDVVIFRIDPTKEPEMAARYQGTTPPTFVQVDANGAALSRWTGGGSAELISHLQ